MLSDAACAIMVLNEFAQKSSFPIPMEGQRCIRASLPALTIFTTEFKVFDWVIELRSIGLGWRQWINDEGEWWIM